MLGVRTASRYRRVRELVLGGARERPLDALLLSLLLKAERLYGRVKRLIGEVASDGSEQSEKSTPAVRRLVMELVSTPDRVRLLERLNEMLDVICHECRVLGSGERRGWRANLFMERQTQASRAIAVLGRERDRTVENAVDARVDVMGRSTWMTLTRMEMEAWISTRDPDEQVELLTLLSFAVSSRGADSSFVWMESEMRVLEDAYWMIVEVSRTVVVTLPEWFVAPTADAMAACASAADSTAEEDEDEAEVTVLPLASLPSLTRDAGEFYEESVIRQADVWATLLHPCIVRLGGACHVGQQFFVVNARLEALVPVEHSAEGEDDDDAAKLVLSQLCEASEGLQFLHRRGFTYSTGGDNTREMDPIRAYSSPVSDRVQLLGAGLRSMARPEAMNATRNEGINPDPLDIQTEEAPARAQADDIYKLGVWIAEWSRSSRRLQCSTQLWSLIDMMLQRNHVEQASSFYVAECLRSLRLDYNGEFIMETRSWSLFEAPEHGLLPAADRKIEDIVAQISERTDDSRVPTRIRDAYWLIRDSDREFPVHVLEEFFIWCYDIIDQLRSSRHSRRGRRVRYAVHDREQNDVVFRGEDDDEPLPEWILRGFEGLGRLLARIGLADYFIDAQLPIDESTDQSSPWLIAPSSEFFNDRYSEIGEGSFASIHLTDWSGARVAIKTLFVRGMDRNSGFSWSFSDQSQSFSDDSVKSSPDEEAANTELLEHVRSAALREAELWQQLDHPNICKMYVACLDASAPFLVTEYAENGDLSRMASSRSGERAAPYAIWSWLLEAAQGLQYVHHNGIVHADLKGNNIMIGANGVAKLIDFGLSFVASEAQDNLDALGAYRWKAPECLSLSNQPATGATFASDVYSFGMCIIEAVSGVVPWGMDQPDAAVRFFVKNGRFPLQPPEISDNEWHLVKRMCCFDAADRLSMDYVVLYLSQLVERLDSPMTLAHTPSSLLRSAFALSSLIKLIASSPHDNSNSLLVPDSFFLTASIVRQASFFKWTSHQVQDLLSLLDNSRFNGKNVWVARVLGQLAPDVLSLAQSIVGADSSVIQSMLALARLGSEGPRLAGVTALRRLSTGCELIKRTIGACDGVNTLLRIARDGSRLPKATAMAVATLRNVSTLGAEVLRTWESMTDPLDGWSLDTFCATLVTVARETIDDSQLFATVRIDVYGALQNVAFRSEYGAASVVQAGGISLATSVLANGAAAETTEAVGALRNVIDSSNALETSTLRRVVVSLVRLLRREEASAESSLVRQAQVVGALHTALAKATRGINTAAAYSGPGGSDAGNEELAALLRRVAAFSESATVRELAAEAALQLVAR